MGTRESRKLAAVALVAMAAATAQASLGQAPDVRCGEDQGPMLDIGIASLGFSSANLRPENERIVWRFASEPWVVSVRPGGPAEGRLERDDRIVSIDGLLITSVEGGRRWSGVGAGRTVSLVVRRGGREREVTLDASFRCQGLPWRWPARADRADRAYTILTPTVVGDSGWMYDARGLRARLRAPREANDAYVRERLRELALGHAHLSRMPARFRVLFGVGIFCADCSFESDSAGAPVDWRFTSSPTVTDVEAGGPAARGGLRVGDVIEALEGSLIVSEAGARHLATARAGRPVRFTVRRNGQSVELTIVPEEPRPHSHGVRPE